MCIYLRILMPNKGTAKKPAAKSSTKSRERKINKPTWLQAAKWLCSDPPLTEKAREDLEVKNKFLDAYDSLPRFSGEKEC